MEKIVDKIGEQVNNSTHLAGSPKWLNNELDKGFNSVWPPIAVELREEIMRASNRLAEAEAGAKCDP